MTALVYIPKHSVAIALSHTNRKGLYRKELIYVGQPFVKDDGKGNRVEFQVDEDTIKHWYNTFNLMRSNGIEVPMPLSHTENPEQRRGTTVDLEIAPNQDNKTALFSIFRYRDKQAEKDLKDADVSIYVPEKFIDGYGNEYPYPIRHIAFTDYPVIPKLGKVQPIAASYAGGDEEENEEINNPKKGSKMTDTNFLRKLATKLGLGKEIPDDKLEKAIMYIIDKLVDEDEGEEENEEGEEEENEEGEEEENEGEEEMNNEENNEEESEEEEETVPPKKKKGGALAREAHVREYHPPISAGFLSLLEDARITKLDRLVEKNCITPATRDKLKEDFCNKEVLALAFAQDGSSLDNFDNLISALEENSVETLIQREASGGQELSLAYSSLNEENNVLLKNAEERRKAVGQN